MSFSALIDDAENKALWCRCIVALASISEQIQFVISESKVSYIERAFNVSLTNYPRSHYQP